MSSLPPQRHPFDVQALLLRTHAYGEGDQIVVAFSREYGLLRLLAKGSRRPKSRLGGLISPLRCLQLALVRGRDLHRITQAESLLPLSGIQNDYDRLTAGLALAEIVSLFCQEEDAQAELYDGLLKTLSALSQSDSPRAVLLWFVIHFLAHQGYWRSTQRCQSCERDFGSEASHYFDTHEAGLHCSDCQRENSPSALRFVTRRQAQILGQMRRLRQPPSSLEEIPENGDTHLLLRYLQRLIQYLLEQELRCFAFLEPIENRGK